jgi:hypothetical protein
MDAVKVELDSECKVEPVTSPCQEDQVDQKLEGQPFIPLKAKVRMGS